MGSIKKQMYPGSLLSEESTREKEHRVIARRAAAEGIVLLKNNGVLPLKAGSKAALYGGGARYTIKGGTGSGSVNNRNNVSIDEGLRNAGFVITTDEWLDAYDKEYNEVYGAWKARIYEMAGEGKDFNKLYRAHACNPLQMPKGMPVTENTKTEAEVAIYIISRVSGEGADRKAVKGDYYLSDDEYKMLSDIASVYAKTIVIINAGGIIDLSFLDEIKVDALVVLSQAGMEGGNALADILSGRVNPSGKLTDTWGYHYEDYPCSATFSHNNNNIIEEKYYEGIYVGYRYFDSFEVTPRYPFGFGLSYTSFAERTENIVVENGVCRVSVSVENIGDVAGKQVIQVYAACPNGKLKKERKRLVAFGKTKLLIPGERDLITLEFELSLLESYRAGKAAYYMEKGSYYIFVGTAGNQVQPEARLMLDESVEIERLINICPLLDALSELEPSNESLRAWEDYLESVCEKRPIKEIRLDGEALVRTKDDVKKTKNLVSKAAKWEKVNKVLSKMSAEQKAEIVCGRGGHAVQDIIGSAGIMVPGAAGETASMVVDGIAIDGLTLADGPAGLRLQTRYEENPIDGSIYQINTYEGLEYRIFKTEHLHEGSIYHYQYCSAIPVGTLLAQSFDLKLFEEVGEMIGREMLEFGVDLWLAPGMNIHRDPLCGRNFEYYSEDPLVSGLMAAAITKGVQKTPGLGTTIKHFVCNNQEENRRGVSSIISERALREIYLKGFEIAVKKSQPRSIMTSYNKVNGVHTANNYDLCTTVARGEWEFGGIFMTDWTTTNADGGSSAAKCISAGNDLIMPGKTTDIQEILDALTGEKDQFLPEEKLDDCVRRILKQVFS